MKDENTRGENRRENRNNTMKGPSRRVYGVKPAGENNHRNGAAAKTVNAADKAEPSRANKPYAKRTNTANKPEGQRTNNTNKPYANRASGANKPEGQRTPAANKPYANRASGNRVTGGSKPYGNRGYGNRSQRFGGRDYDQPDHTYDGIRTLDKREYASVDHGTHFSDRRSSRRNESSPRTAEGMQDRRTSARRLEHTDAPASGRPVFSRATPGPRVGAIYADVPAAEQVRENMSAPAPVADVEENENLLVGRNPIREALKAGRPVEKLMVAQGDLSGAAREIIRMARDAGAVVQEVDRSRLDQIYPAHQGMLAFVAAVEYKSVEDILAYAAEKGEDPFIIICDGITDPHNLGAILRSAECAGAHGVIVPERRAAGLGPAAAKATAGAINFIRIARVKNLNRAIDELKEKNIWICGTAMAGENALNADLTGPLALVIGSEGDGISKLTQEKCDRMLTLPMKGQIESLNASVAAGILMYEVVRARAK